MSTNTKAEQLLQRMNRRVSNKNGVEIGIDEKKTIIDQITGDGVAATEAENADSNGDGTEQTLGETTTDKGQTQIQVKGESSLVVGQGHVPSENDLSLGLASIATEVVQEIKQRKTKKDTHRNATFQLPIELLERFDRIAKMNKNVRGFKEKTVQRLLEQFCDAYERHTKKPSN